MFRKKMRSKPPNFIIIGAQKSGTTALYDFLDRHPNIKGSKIKETDYFYSDKFLELGEDYYLSNFSYPFSFFKKNLLFEASPSYLNDHRGVVASRIHSYNPEIKIICILRNPVYRAFSAWNMHKKQVANGKNFFFEWHSKRNYISKDEFISRTPDEFEYFDLAVSRELKMLQEGKRIQYPIVSNGFYYEKLNPYFNLFRRDQILVLENNFMLENTNDCLNSIMNFLGLRKVKWEKFIKNDEIIFSGNYEKTSLNKEVKSLLESVYHKENLKLFNLIDKKFHWCEYE